MGENAEAKTSGRNGDEDDLLDLLDVKKGTLLGSTGVEQIHPSDEANPAVVELALEDLAPTASAAKAAG